MRNTIFDAIVNLLQGVQKLTSETGKVMVYDYPITVPASYPYVVVGCTEIISTAIANTQDERTYGFSVQIIGEKFGDQVGKTQSQALKVMRNIEDSVLSAFAAENALGLGLQMIVVDPINAQWTYTTDQQHVMLSMKLDVKATVDIIQ